MFKRLPFPTPGEGGEGVKNFSSNPNPFQLKFSKLNYYIQLKKKLLEVFAIHS